ncbi:MAG: NfeD family protein [Pseudomonadota bacterium]
MNIGLEPWHVWTVVGVCLFIGEVFVPGFILASLGIGAFCGALLHQLTGDMGWGLGGFAAGSAVSLMLIRPYIARALGPEADTKFGADTMVGDTITISDAGDVGGSLKAQYRDTLWSLKTSDELFEGDRAKIIAVEGATLVVQRIEEE